MDTNIDLVSESCLKNDNNRESLSDNLIQPSLLQLDGNITSSSLTDSSSDVSQDFSDSSYSTEDELDPVLTPVSLSPFQPLPNQPVKLEVKKKNPKLEQASSLPLISVMNARSLYPKKENFKTFVKELGIEIAIVSETWERER